MRFIFVALVATLGAAMAAGKATIPAGGVCNKDGKRNNRAAGQRLFHRSQNSMSDNTTSFWLASSLDLTFCSILTPTPFSTYQRNSNAPVSYEGQHTVDVLNDKALGFLDDATAAQEPFLSSIVPVAPHSDA
ncbi:hypothetical protein PENANT_c015G03443 [Penicillium antarcticum]|uniref:Uncharacterized protein n=1 Tax=Penicillium antarcticum TaxID=416450 RepID=A0A1V6Q3I5_9EURO|nr:hypothetical protein PENANT_c015G03443 [Penicillium antarcticum]